MKFPYEQFDLSHPRTYPLKSRTSKARLEDFGRPCGDGAGIGQFVDSLPNILAGADFKAIVQAIIQAKRRSGIVWGIGAHVIKTGLSPVLIDLMERGFVSAIATNGAGVIHDFEIALVGATSEDVDEALGPGRFGMAEETGRLLNEAMTTRVNKGMGLGQAVGDFLVESKPQLASSSILRTAARLDIPVQSTFAIGTDIATAPGIPRLALREGAHALQVSGRERCASEMASLPHCGSAVVLPEVFLKAVAVARNEGIELANLTAVNLDFIRHYRPQTNVVTRPTAVTGRGYSLVGHHEIMIPLLAAAIVESAART